MSLIVPKNKVVIGDGIAALVLVASFLKSSRSESSLAEPQLIWISGEGSRISPALAGLDLESAEFMKQVLDAWEVDCGDVLVGNTIREYKNKAFKVPAWLSSKLASSSSASATQAEHQLWAPEQRWSTCGQARFESTLIELENLLRQRLSDEALEPRLRRIDAVPVLSIQETNDSLSVGLGSGELIENCEVYFADRWSLLQGIDGLPRPLSFLRNTTPMGVLQAHFMHNVPVGSGVQESFILPLYRDAGEVIDRNVWGYFHSCGTKSTWSLCLAPEEVQDNHSIAKRFRKMKSTLDRAFSGTAVLPEGVASFGATLGNEQVRFEEEAIYSSGTVHKKPVTLKSLAGVWFLTDGFGPGVSLSQVAAVCAKQLGLESKGEITLGEMKSEPKLETPQSFESS